MSATRRSFSNLPGSSRRLLLAAAPGRLPIRKAVEFSMLPRTLGVREKFQLAKRSGFEAIECPTTPEAERADEILAASKEVGLPVHSVMNQEHWRSPLSSADPAVVDKSMEGMRTSLRNAKLWGADTVLLVPAVVNPQTSYAQAWERSQRQIRELIPLAAELKVIIGIEEVWNKFLLSPLEFAHYVDEFKVAVDSRLFRYRKRGHHRLPGRLDPHVGQADCEVAREGFLVQEAVGGVPAVAGGRYRLESGARRAGGDRIPGHGDGGTQWRRWRLPGGGQSPVREDFERAGVG